MREVSHETSGTLCKDGGGASWSGTGARRPVGLATQALTCVPTIGTPAWQRWRLHHLHTKGQSRMKDNKRRAVETLVEGSGASIPNRILGTLRDALHAASRESTGEVSESALAPREPAHRPPAPTTNLVAASVPTPSERVQPPLPRPLPPPISAAEALRLAKAPVVAEREEKEPTTRVVRAMPPLKPMPASPTIDDVGRTQAVRGKPKVIRSSFHQDPVVGWLVVVGGPGSGPIAQSMRATTRSAAPRRSAFPSTLAMIPSPRRSRLISAMILSTARSCLFPTWPRPTLSRSTIKSRPGPCRCKPWM